MKKHLLVVGIIFLFILSSVSPIVFGFNIQISKRINDGNTLYVGGSGTGNYTRIQDAINDSLNGDTIYVYNGTYHERLVMDKSITLIGENKDNTIINMAGAGSQSAIIKVSALNVCINGFTINQLSGDGKGILLASNNSIVYDNNINYANWGITLYNSNFSEIYNNVIMAKNSGVSLTGWKDVDTYNVIHNNTITVTGCPGYYFFGGIRIDYQSHNIIKDNYLYDCYEEGIVIYGSETNRPPGADNNTISNNIIESINTTMKYGIHLAYNDVNASNTIIGNTISKSEYGILINNNNNIVSENIITDTNFSIYIAAQGQNNKIIGNILLNSDNTGIAIDSDSSYTIVSENLIDTDGTWGITLMMGTGNKITKNIITNNSIGIWPIMTIDTIIKENNFLQNGKHVSLLSDKCTFEKNYWDDYTGEDNDNNGIGDTPYSISLGNKDYYPLMEPYYGFDPDAPSAPYINGPPSGEPGVEYEYMFVTTDPSDDDVFFYITWGDGTFENWIGPYASGEMITLNHTWYEKDNFPIIARAKDTNGLIGPWGILTVNMPRNKAMLKTLFMRFLEQFPLLERFLTLFIN